MPGYLTVAVRCVASNVKLMVLDLAWKVLSAVAGSFVVKLQKQR